MINEKTKVERKYTPKRKIRQFFVVGALIKIAIGILYFCLVVRRPDETFIRTNNNTIRILYIITSREEYNTGMRSTIKDSDRLRETIIPVLQESVGSILELEKYDVDVFLICHWIMKPERLRLLRTSLPEGVGFEYWDDATPLGYRLEERNETAKLLVTPITRSLARQHRFVIKEKILDYDFFVNFEDDMLIKGKHISHYIRITKELSRLKKIAPEEPTDYNLSKASIKDINNRFYGQLTKRQLSRMLPGFIRVEVLLDNTPAQSNTGPIPVDLNFSDGKMHRVDPTVCCHYERTATMPQKPAADKVFLWETRIDALGLRRMPQNSTLGWVLFQRGPEYGNKDIYKPEIIGDYWSGRNGEFESQRPYTGKGIYLNNQGGWMATRQQILDWHGDICPGGFLPPFDATLDGLDLRNVEYWSGGLQLFTRDNACNMQRIIEISDPQKFSKHLLYHTANNKQRHRKGQREERFVTANTLLGQLNSVKKKAEEALHKIQ